MEVDEEMQLPAESEEERSAREERERSAHEAAEALKRKMEEASKNFETYVLKKQDQLWEQMQSLISKFKESEKELDQLHPFPETPLTPGFFWDFVEGLREFARRKSPRKTSITAHHAARRSQGLVRRSKIDLDAHGKRKDLVDGKLVVDMSKIKKELDDLEEDVFAVADILEDLNDKHARKTDLRAVIMTDPDHPDDPALLVNSRRYVPGEIEELKEEEFLKYDDFKARLEWLIDTHGKSRIDVDGNDEDYDDDGKARVQYNKIGDVWALSAVVNTVEEAPSKADSEAAAEDSVVEGVINVDASMKFSFDLADNHLQLAEVALQALERRRIRQKNAHIAVHTHFTTVPSGGSANTGSAERPAVAAPNLASRNTTAAWGLSKSTPRFPAAGSAPLSRATAVSSKEFFRGHPKQHQKLKSANSRQPSMNMMAFNLRS